MRIKNKSDQVQLITVNGKSVRILPNSDLSIPDNADLHLTKIENLEITGD